MSTLRRTDVKAYFANERTFLHWMHMSVTIGTISSAILGLTANSFEITDAIYHYIKILCIFMIFVAIIVNGLSLYNFSRRNRSLMYHLSTGHDSRLPATLVSISLTILLTLVFAGGLYSYFTTEV